MSKDLSIKLPDGRTLSYSTFGSALTPESQVLFYFHGFPGTHNEGLPVHEAASQRGILVVGVTRPGFGESTQQPNRTLLSFAADVLHLADHLSIRRFAIMGISGGGPYALACLRAIPADRLCGVAVVSGMWPVSFSTAGMMAPMRIMYNIARWAPGVVKWMVGRELVEPANDTEHPERFDELMTIGFKRWPAEDQEVIFGNEGKLFKVLSQSSREAIKYGTAGFACEAKLFGSAWDFALEDLPVDDGRLVMWHGGKDANVPVAMAEKASKVMPKVPFHKYDGEAHLSLSIKYLKEILDVVVSKLQA